MLISLFENLSQKESVLILQDKFKSYGLRTLYRILTQFCDKLARNLIDVQEDHPKQIREYSPLFTGTWLLMLQVYILKIKQRVK